MPFLEEIRLANLLSFGPDTEVLRLRPLNLVIGANGSGKSNLLSAIELLRNAPTDLLRPFIQGGIVEWLNGSRSASPATIDTVLSNPDGRSGLRYVLSFTEQSQRIACELLEERLEYAERDDLQKKQPYFFYRNLDGNPVVNVADGENRRERRLRRETIDPDRSILSQRRDPDSYPELTRVAQSFASIRLYRDWSFGPNTPVRRPNRTDLPNEALLPDTSNLATVLYRLTRKSPAVRQTLLDAVRQLYEGIVDFDFPVEGGTIALQLREGDTFIPATRLSDGTLRLMSLLAILCDPDASGLICIEEPELGLHPDIMPLMSHLLREASERCQLIVTTHSELLVDAMTDRPEDVVICEKRDGETAFKRLSSGELEPWLERYRLGELWSRGELGGTRW